ncbi:hypothetical protein [Arthrobacter sp. H20]|uniref:hypothetical protein n=1 Tax=Arthrobacter sp. H20 TaxID=1267981 RepID=UPI001C1E69A4|nr:hypothetical protein [Arthrobacter sp. H20]
MIADLRFNPAGPSASEVALRLGLARVSARRYLEFLVARDQAMITPKYGSAGRPEKRYAWDRVTGQERVGASTRSNGRPTPHYSSAVPHGEQRYIIIILPHYDENVNTPE